MSLIVYLAGRNQAYRIFTSVCGWLELARVLDKPLSEDFIEKKKAIRSDWLRKQKERFLEVRKTLEAMEDEKAAAA